MHFENIVRMLQTVKLSEDAFRIKLWNPSFIDTATELSSLFHTHTNIYICVGMYVYI